MRYKDQHEAFKQLAIQRGISSVDQLNEALPLGYDVPAYLINRWLNKLLALPSDFSTQRRYVNRFKLGADPEFICMSDLGKRCDAKLLNLSQGLAFGMDNNGRLIEIRPYPSRSAVAVTASILATLRWFSLLCPDSMAYNWVCGAFLCGDGLGGHVHFGRKRPTRNAEIKALDCIDEELTKLKAYPEAEVKRRREGDEHHQFYGKPGDFRPQRHGYEYRTFPSWLDSPALAFLTITLSKLAVHNPLLIQGFQPLGPVAQMRRIWNLLSYYKDSDDDARLALQLIARHFPTHMGGDFKRRWGITKIEGFPLTVAFLPSSIKPTALEIEEVFAALQGKALTMKVPVPTWGPLQPPSGYVMSISKVNTHGAKGLGEMVWDIVQHKDFRYNIVSYKDPSRPLEFFLMPKELISNFPSGWQRLCPNRIRVSNHRDGKIYSNEFARDPEHLQEARSILLNLGLPFWKISQVKADSWQQWVSAAKNKASTRQEYSDKMVWGDKSLLPIVF